MTQSTDDLVKRPAEFEFAMEFLGDPEETIVRQYVAELARTIERLQADLAARDKTIETLREDAERYRLLRNHFVYNDWGHGSITFHWQGPMSGKGSLEATKELYCASLDAAIDAARSEEKP